MAEQEGGGFAGGWGSGVRLWLCVVWVQKENLPGNGWKG